MKKIIAFVCSLALLAASGSTLCISAKPCSDTNSMRFDVNGDSSITVKDLSAVKEILLEKEQADININGDVNYDGKVNILDFIYLRAFLMGNDNGHAQQLPVSAVSYGYLGGRLYSSDAQKYACESFLINTYSELQSFISDLSDCNIINTDLSEKYDKDFFEDKCVVISSTDHDMDSDFFKSAEIIDNTLYMNFNDYCYSDPLTSPGYCAVDIEKSVLNDHHIDNVRYCTDFLQIPADRFKISNLTMKSDDHIDTWIKTQDELSEILKKQDLDSEGAMSYYNTEFFKDNRLLAMSGVNAEEVSAYMNNEYLSLRLRGYQDDQYLTLISVPDELIGERQTDIETNFANVGYKPAIYLYPEEETDVSVNVDLNGRFTCLYPELDDPDTKTWNVKAEPDGTLYTKDGSEYSYLFWEGTIHADWDMSKGFVVKGSDTLAFFRKQLPLMGLTPKEYNDFIVYWLPQMQNNEYNYITFQTDSYTDNAVLNVTPQPDSVLRVFMAYEAVSQEEAEILRQTTEEPEFDTFVRDGFSVVEWGGTQIIR